MSSSGGKRREAVTVEYLRVFCAVRFSWPETVTDQQSCRLLFNLWKLSKEKS